MFVIYLQLTVLMDYTLLPSVFHKDFSLEILLVTHNLYLP